MIEGINKVRQRLDAFQEEAEKAKSQIIKSESAIERHKSRIEDGKRAISDLAAKIETLKQVLAEDLGEPIPEKEETPVPVSQPKGSGRSSRNGRKFRGPTSGIKSVLAEHGPMLSQDLIDELEDKVSSGAKTYGITFKPQSLTCSERGRLKRTQLERSL